MRNSPRIHESICRSVKGNSLLNICLKYPEATQLNGNTQKTLEISFRFDVDSPNEKLSSWIETKVKLRKEMAFISVAVAIMLAISDDVSECVNKFKTYVWCQSHFVFSLSLCVGLSPILTVLHIYIKFIEWSRKMSCNIFSRSSKMQCRAFGFIFFSIFSSLFLQTKQ